MVPLKVLRLVIASIPISSVVSAGPTFIHGNRIGGRVGLCPAIRTTALKLDKPQTKNITIVDLPQRSRDLRCCTDLLDGDTTISDIDQR
ncbi:hypothetical protein DFS33DRAFT_1303826 [Desarmillaria ectypa]|nr:hypothetical protein DFS33DRAFT_1303826 [Desarmillaria ectypa]